MVFKDGHNVGVTGGAMPSMTCNECGASLTSLDDVMRHVETAHPTSSHNPSGDIVCPGCPATFRQLVVLRRHLTEAHGM